MANVTANNADYVGDLLVWLNIGSDTPGVYKYTCPVDSHRIVSAVRLGWANVRNSAAGGDGAVTSSVAVDTTPVCPVHDTTLTGEGFVSCA